MIPRDALDRWFDETAMRFGWPSFEMSEIGSIPIDLYEEGDNLIVKASVPGIKPEVLNVQLRDDMLLISGEVREDTEHEDRDYYLHEHRYGRLERSLALPYPVVSDKAEAVFENGILTLRLPRAAETNSRRIAVQVRK